MMGYNKVILAGNVTRDPEIKTVGIDNKVCKFAIAVNKKYKNAQGETVESVCFVNIEAWSKLSELCGKYIKKGSCVLVDGRLNTRTYDKDGIKMNATEVIADNVVFLDKKPEDKCE